MSDVMRTIKESIETEIQAQLGPDFRKLAYVEDVSKNSFRTSSERYGVRALVSTETDDTVTKRVTFNQVFEIVLTRQYLESSIDDDKQTARAFDNREDILAVYLRLRDFKAGVPNIVLLVSDLLVEEPEYLTEEKVAVQRAQVTIRYRLNIN